MSVKMIFFLLIDFFAKSFLLLVFGNVLSVVMAIGQIYQQKLVELNVLIFTIALFARCLSDVSHLQRFIFFSVNIDHNVVSPHYRFLVSCRLTVVHI